MQNKIIFYIVVHDINLINLFENTKKYSILQNYKYLLVGNHEKDYTSENIIQCNKLNNNIEEQNNYLAYTAWYALVKNITIKEDYICLLEYDTDITNKFNYDNLILQLEKKDVNVYGFFNLDTTIGFLTNDIFSNKLIHFLKLKNIREIRPNNKKWIVTNNSIFKNSFLKEFIEDSFTQELFKYFNNDKMSGHYLERYLSVYCFIKDKIFSMIDGEMFIHRALDSHNTQNRKFGSEGYEKFKTANKISD